MAASKQFRNVLESHCYQCTPVPTLLLLPYSNDSVLARLGVRQPKLSQAHSPHRGRRVSIVHMSHATPVLGGVVSEPLETDTGTRLYLRATTTNTLREAITRPSPQFPVPLRMLAIVRRREGTAAAATQQQQTPPTRVASVYVRGRRVHHY